MLYAPEPTEVYPEGFATAVEVGGAHRRPRRRPRQRGPGHFRGVTTVVAKLFNSVQPDVAFFGQKDAQQAIVIRRMARDLDFPVEIEVLPTVREPDGLAMSSRNAYLDDAERERALAISRALAPAEATAAPTARPPRRWWRRPRRAGVTPGVEPEYLEARDAEELYPVAELNGRPVLVAVAAQVGGARLIDNVLIEQLTRRGRPMQRQMLKSKIHRATVTDCDVDYIGSITIDTELMRQADLLTNEQVHVWDIDNGARFVTYVIDGEPGSGTMQVNGAAARLVRQGDKVIVASFGAYDESDLEAYSPVVVHVDEDNRAVRVDSDPRCCWRRPAGHEEARRPAVADAGGADMSTAPRAPNASGRKPR